MLGVCMLLGGVPAVYDLLDLADDVFHDAADAVSGDLQSRIGLRLLRGCLGDRNWQTFYKNVVLFGRRYLRVHP